MAYDTPEESQESAGSERWGAPASRPGLGVPGDETRADGIPEEAGPARDRPAPFDNQAPGETHSPGAEEPPPRVGAPSLDQARMEEALAEAWRAWECHDEVPIGAIIVLDGEVIGRGYNRVRTDGTPLAHAELLALTQAVQHLGAPRIPGAIVYTTVEPCAMCAGALLHARVARVVWGVRDPKFGGCVSLANILSDPRANHRAELTEGVRADEARELLQSFFRSKRAMQARPE